MFKKLSSPLCYKVIFPGGHLKFGFDAVSLSEGAAGIRVNNIQEQNIAVLIMY